MFLSVIIPVYNVEKYLNKCVSSVLENDLTDCEIILVDDGSPDSSGLICDELAKKNPGLIRVIHQLNLGLGGARNTGIKEAEGDYLWFVDSDDFIPPDAVEKLRLFTKNEPLSMVVFDYFMAREDGSVIKTVPAYEGGDTGKLEDKPDMLFMVTSATTRITKKALFTEAGVLFPEKQWYEDLDAITRLYPFAGKIGYIKAPLYYYVQRAGSIMNSSAPERTKEIITAVGHVAAAYREYGLAGKYSEELTYLAVLHVFILACSRVAKADPGSGLLPVLRQYVYDNCPGFEKNRYLRLADKKKRLIFSLVRGGSWRSLSALMRLKEKLNGLGEG